ncbi:MAG: potassium transporter Trk [Ruminococcaceae bacterium]|nr:potassium transporter Trk [Oscillospiraceae bacterium]
MPILNKSAKNPFSARTLVIGFFIIIVVGAFLLCLPISSRTGSFTSYFDCLFTATSATCVTGLIVFDTYTQWNLFGQIIIALLIQIGGLGFVTIITFFNIAAGKKLGYRTIAVAADGLTESSFEGGRKIFVSIMKYSLIFEVSGAALLATVFVPRYGLYGIWVSIFMSVTAFCNAGFDLMGQEEQFSSLIHFNSEPIVLITIALLIIVGGLGFIVWENFINIRKVRKLSLHSYAVLIMTGILIFGGMAMYLAAEWNNPDTLGSMSIGDKLLNSFFSSVTARTAGYNSISLEEMRDFSQLGTIFLMFIGAAPASTGGGIKVTTLLVLIMIVPSYISNKNDVEIFGHKVNKLAVYRTLVISVLSMAVVSLCFTVLYCTTPDTANAAECLFEAVSAFSTTGLSVGVTAECGIVGRIILIVTMFIGRVGPVSLIMSLTLNGAKRKNVVVPEGQIIIG